MRESPCSLLAIRYSLPARREFEFCDARLDEEMAVIGLPRMLFALGQKLDLEAFREVDPFAVGDGGDHLFDVAFESPGPRFHNVDGYFAVRVILAELRAEGAVGADLVEIDDALLDTRLSVTEPNSDQRGTRRCACEQKSAGKTGENGKRAAQIP